MPKSPSSGEVLKCSCSGLGVPNFPLSALRVKKVWDITRNGYVNSLIEFLKTLVITTAELHSTKPELRFCAGSNSARSVSEICGDEISHNGPGWK